MQNIINIKGEELEDKLKDWLNENKIPYTKSVKGPKGDIDFIIHTNKTKLFIECANQNIKGSVVDKIPHKVFKYWFKHKMDTIYLLRGSYNKFTKSIMEHIKHIENTCDIKVHIVTFNQIQKILNNKKLNKNKFF